MTLILIWLYSSDFCCVVTHWRTRHLAERIRIMAQGQNRICWNAFMPRCIPDQTSFYTCKCLARVLKETPVWVFIQVCFTWLPCFFEHSWHIQSFLFVCLFVCFSPWRFDLNAFDKKEKYCVIQSQVWGRQMLNLVLNHSGLSERQRLHS